jgi:hypothetical protein
MTEDLIRDLLSDEARAVPVDVDLLAGVAAQRGVRRRRRLVSGAAGLAAVVVLAAVGTTVAVRHGGPDTRNGPAVSAAPTTYPAGTRPVTWAGIQLDVPASWATAPSDGHRCAAADAMSGGEVDYAGSDSSSAYGCFDAAHPVHERLELGTAYSFTAFSQAEAGPPGTIDFRPTRFAGYAATQDQVGYRGQLVTEYKVPQLGTVFTLTTNTSAEVSAIVDTAHAVAFDQNGCPVAQAGGFPSTTSGSTGPVLSSTPAGGTVCNYTAGRLTSGVTLDGDTTEELSAALHRLPETYTPAEVSAQRSDDQVMSSQTAQLLLRDTDGSVQRVTIASGSAPMVAGAHRSALTSELFFDLSGALPGTFGGAGADGAAIPDGCQSCGTEKAPPPTRPVTYRGITLNVPATWTDEAAASCGPGRDDVVFTYEYPEDEDASCPAGPPRASYLAFARHQAGDVVGHAASFAGSPAHVTTERGIPYSTETVTTEGGDEHIAAGVSAVSALATARPARA